MVRPQKGQNETPHVERTCMHPKAERFCIMSWARQLVGRQDVARVSTGSRRSLEKISSICESETQSCEYNQPVSSQTFFFFWKVCGLMSRSI